MYEAFFNLTKKPFELVPNPEFLFLSRSHKRALTYLDYGIRERSGFILLTGEIGSGKTTIVRDLIKKLDKTVVTSNIFNTKVNSEQLIAMINDEFGLEARGKNKIMLLKELNEFLIDQYGQGNRSLLLIDEAQNLNPELLEELRMLSNLENDVSKLLQIVLVGQPELRDTLSLPELRQFRQRVSVSCHINPLTRQETEEYILHRLAVAGNKDAVHFSESVLDMIFSFGRGIPRIINIICDYIMLAAFIDETKEITDTMAREIIEDLDGENRYWQDSNPHSKSRLDGADHVTDKIADLEKSFGLMNKDNEQNAVRVSELAKKIDENTLILVNKLKKLIDGIKKIRNTIEDLEDRLTRVESSKKSAGQVTSMAAHQKRPTVSVVPSQQSDSAARKEKGFLSIFNKFEVNELIKQAKKEYYTDGDVITLTGTPADEILVVREGRVTITVSEDGESREIKTLRVGDIFCHVDEMREGKKMTEGIAQGITTIYRIPQKGIQDIVSKRPEIAHELDGACNADVAGYFTNMRTH